MYRNRLPLMAVVLFALLAALWGGLLRLGWRWPALRPVLPVAHGPLMVSGFLGTLIGLERALGSVGGGLGHVATRRRELVDTVNDADPGAHRSVAHRTWRKAGARPGGR